MPIETAATLPPPPSEAALATPTASHSQVQSTGTPEATPAASSSPKPAAIISQREGSANDSGTPVTATAPRTTRFLNDVEAEENRYLYETLYKSLAEPADTAIRDELTVGDTVRFARDAKREFIAAATMPMGEKVKNCSALARSFLQKKNQQVAHVFIVFSVLMTTMPVIVLLIGMRLIAPRLDMDPTLCGGGLAVFTAISLMGSYVVYAMVEEAQCGRQNASETESKKER
ncbi:conserved hypothetical protein [Leishmania major strain Friedlin]|uniref:Uncharacterized protein n=1 Tax=Leishmania major TaxID=5664 RepID=E9AFP6_LEIMA|nr:conserved hypothetical protein [Leishmania major strain Friedlin]CAG9582777.1 hypothetical_protein_-_conserved [Leishmania major strain Friedlin]CBZ13050.1 conserved hypothetical protein [Leishmania major strain Friedlin]|eukprot:XP_003722816.1 conserved hypothetical protein [Leishmania major strain Friedlin]